MATSRILYLAPDLGAPAGGLNVIYTHVAWLNQAGYPAYVVHETAGGFYRFAPVEAPVLAIDQGLSFARGDALVLPEAGSEIFAQLSGLTGVRRYVFCQNHFYLLQNLAPGEADAFADFGIHGVICASEPVRDSLARVLGIPDAPVVHGFVDPSVFGPGEKKLRVACMPRKRGFEQSVIRNALAWTHPEHRDVEWVHIHGMDQQQCARELGEAAVFLGLSHFEGLGLPPLEAMAAGCLVVGFTGFGGLEYATEHNGLWAPESDLLECARLLGQALDGVKLDHPKTKAMIRAGMDTAAAYSPDRARRELLAFWDRAGFPD
jgi:hypothetical protein